MVMTARVATGKRDGRHLEEQAVGVSQLHGQTLLGSSNLRQEEEMHCRCAYGLTRSGRSAAMQNPSHEGC